MPKLSNSDGCKTLPTEAQHGNDPSKKKAQMVASADMGVFCFNVLSSLLHGTEPAGQLKFTNDPYPIFVTWRIGTEKRLRGCVGTFQAMNLHSGLKEYAIISATQDPRFSPISKDEFPQLHVAVSILLLFEPGDDYLDWQVGFHGIRIEFLDDKGYKKTATFLPEVAAEFNDKIATIDALLKKAGFRGTITDDLRKSIKLTRYQTEKIEVGYEEYKDIISSEC